MKSNIDEDEMFRSTARRILEKNERFKIGMHRDAKVEHDTGGAWVEMYLWVPTKEVVA